MLTHDRKRAVALLLAIGAAGCGGTVATSLPPPDPSDSDAAAPPAPKLDAQANAGDVVRRDTPQPAAPSGPIAPWAARSIGPPGPQREEVRSGTGVMVVRAGGSEINGTADSFQFVSQKVRGDFELVARVRSLQQVDRETKAGIMVRANDTEPGAANVFLAVLADPMKGGVLQWRATGGGPTTVGAPDPGVRAAAWLRITRKGRTFTAYRSAARLVWTKVGSADVELPPETSVGIAVSARSAMLATTAEIDGLRLHSFESQPATKDWLLEEMGAIGASAVWNGTTLAFAGLGDTPSLLTDSGAFAYASASGNQTLTVRVAAFTHEDPFARVALMIREGPPVLFTRTQPSVILSVTAALGVQFQSRAANNLMATVAPVKDGLKAPIWLRLERSEEPGPLSSRFTGSYSDDGRVWTPVGSAVFALPEPYLIGLLGNSNGSTTPAMATLTDLSLTSGVTPTPPPPPAPMPDAARPADARPDAGADGRM